jgi:hypothetical protein
LLAQDAGKSGLAFLKVGVGSRGAALGEAYSALVNEPTALYWNPAGLAAVRGTHVTFTHLSWLQSINHEFAAVTFPGFGGTLGLGLIAQTIPGIQIRTKPTAEPIGTFDAQDLAVMLAFSRQWRPNLAAGFAVKYLYEKIYLNSAAGFAVDLGGLWQTPVEHLRLGVTAQNLGVMEALQKEELKLPALVRLGGAYVLPFTAGENHLAFAVEHVLFLQGGNGSSVGAEFLFTKHWRCARDTNSAVKIAASLAASAPPSAALSSIMATHRLRMIWAMRIGFRRGDYDFSNGFRNGQRLLNT